MDIQWHNKKNKQKLKHILTKKENENSHSALPLKCVWSDWCKKEESHKSTWITWSLMSKSFLVWMRNGVYLTQSQHRIGQCANCAYFGFLVSIWNIWAVEPFPIRSEYNTLYEMSVVWKDFWCTQTMIFLSLFSCSAMATQFIFTSIANQRPFHFRCSALQQMMWLHLIWFTFDCNEYNFNHYFVCRIVWCFA